MPVDDTNWPALLHDEATPLADALAQILVPFIGPFRSSNAQLIGNDGIETTPLGCVLHTGTESNRVPIDSVAAVIDCHDMLSPRDLAGAYQLIRAAKSLRKSEGLDPTLGEKHMTMGIIIARRSALNLEQIADEMEHLNGTLPSHFWPDVVAVLDVGLINYTAHMPASDSSGDFYLPAEDIATNSPVPSVWVNKLIRAAGPKTIHKVASLVVARLAIFEYRAKLPDYKVFLDGFPTHGATTLTYQFNLAGVLVSMTREQAIDRMMPRDTYEIVSRKKVLGAVQFWPWQDGGVFVVRGMFPIEPFLIFLRQVVPGLTPQHLQSFQGKGERVSFVLPIQYPQFLQTLAEFEKRSSNISIRRQDAKWLVQQVDDDGSSSPFVARLMIGLLGMRGSAFADKAARDRFDELYEPLLTSLRNAREGDQEIRRLWTEHRDKIQSGEIVKIDRRTVHIRENIDRHLRKELEAFLNTAARSIKTHLQALAMDLGFTIGCLFQKDAAFQTGISNLRVSDPLLADYLVATRLWNEPLVTVRNDLEHGLINAPKVSYRLSPLPVQIDEPTFEGRPVTQFTSEALDRICCLVEELVVYMLSRRLPPTFVVSEIPLAIRSAECPERFRLTVLPGGHQAWTLVAHVRRFDVV